MATNRAIYQQSRRPFMFFANSKFFFATISLLLAMAQATANCVNLAGAYQCDSRTSAEVSQTTNGQGIHIYTFSSGGQRPVRYVADGATLTEGNLVSVCNQNRLRVYAGNFGFLIDYSLDASGALKISAYSTRRNEANPDNIPQAELHPMSSSSRTCQKTQ